MGDVTYRELVNGLRAVGLTRDSHVVVHASLSRFGHVRGGAEAVAAALVDVCGTVVMPAFTYQTLVVPPAGPAGNGLSYEDLLAQNEFSEFWRPDLPIHRTVGAIPEALRRHRAALRSDHPALSFIAVGRLAGEVIAAQKLEAPLAPLEVLLAHRGDLLLLGVGMTRATIVHLAERRAGRRGFVRWALTTQLAPLKPQSEILLAPTRRLTADVAHSTAQRSVAHQLLFAPPDRQSSSIREIPDFPGCSDGFDQLEPYLADVARLGQIGQAPVRRYPLGAVMLKATALIREDPEALLCADPGCERCKAVRRGAEPQAGPLVRPALSRN